VHMRYSTNAIYTPGKIMVALLFCAGAAAAFGQVLPSEVSNYRARAAESKYLPQLEALQQEIGTTKFPHPFQLARYVNAKAGRAAMDRDGLEFVSFEHRIILKVSGIYQVAFDAGLRSENQRVAQTLEGAGVPLLRMAAEGVPAGDDYDGIGLEIVYNTHDTNSAYSFEGREVLSAVFSRADALAFVNSNSDAVRQDILNRSDLYVSGKPFGLALGQRDPMDPGSSEDTAKRVRADQTDSAILVRASAALRAAAKEDVGAEATVAATRNVDVASAAVARGATPSLEHAGDQALMHVSLENSLSFDGANTSIYKRAAQSFDLFLAPVLRGIIKTVPADAKFDAFKLSVVNHVSNGARPSETVDYICPKSATQAFLENKITSQDLIDQSTVLVNGVRIGLNLAAVE